MRAAIVDHGLAAWLAGVAPRTRRVASVCSGAFALAAAGLLDGREATTHWRVCDMLQAMRPQVRVQRERIYVHDGPVWTSAGVTTGIEPALAERVQMSPRHFARAFAAQTGCTPARFVEHHRLATAEQLLRRTSWTQERIASRSGFGSVDALQRAFARQHGLTPQAFREGRPPLPAGSAPLHTPTPRAQ